MSAGLALELQPAHAGAHFARWLVTLRAGDVCGLRRGRRCALLCHSSTATPVFYPWSRFRADCPRSFAELLVRSEIRRAHPSATARRPARSPAVGHPFADSLSVSYQIRRQTTSFGRFPPVAAAAVPANRRC